MTIPAVKQATSRYGVAPLDPRTVGQAKAIRDATLEITTRRQQTALDTVARAVGDHIREREAQLLSDVDAKIQAAVARVETRLDQMETERLAALTALNGTVAALEARLEQMQEAHLAAFEKLTELMRELPIPLVQVAVPEQQPPVVNVHAPRRGVVTKTIEFDAYGRPV
jgi:hypothetical protein